MQYPQSIKIMCWSTADPITDIINLSLKSDSFPDATIYDYYAEHWRKLHYRNTI